MINLKDAQYVIAAAEAKAREIGQPMNIAVVDGGGNLVSHIRMDRERRLTAVIWGVALLLSAGAGNALDVDVKSFRCITKMTPVRQFYVDNLEGNLDAALAAANATAGAVYPPGSVVQLIPG